MLWTLVLPGSLCRSQRMSRLFAIVLLLAHPAWAGDEFLTPVLRTDFAFESTDPGYRSIGLEESEGARTLFVVADPSEVLSQNRVNRIVRDALRRSPGITRIMFYTSVHDKPVYPAFAIYDHLAVYVLEENKTHYGVAAKKLYGGWAYGPNR